MPEQYYTMLTPKQQEIVAGKIQQKSQVSMTIVKQALEELNPFMEVEGEKVTFYTVVLNRILSRIYNILTTSNNHE